MRRHYMIALAVLAAGEARAQRAGENVVAEAEDAFGLSVGGVELGLYNASDVRGFSPVEAGNVRIDGLYVDRQAEFTSRLTNGHVIRVGFATLGYPFPAPTGIADYKLRRAGEKAVASIVARAHDFGGGFLETDLQIPLFRGGALAAGGGIYRNEYHDGTDAWVTSVALAPRFSGASFEFIPFFSSVYTFDRTAATTLRVRGDYLPQRPPRRVLLGQDWARTTTVASNYGAVANMDLGDWTVRGGLFRSERAVGRGYSSQFTGIGIDGVGQRVIGVAPPQHYASLSGELRASRQVDEGRRRHMVTLSLRARDQKRLYGGQRSHIFGPGRPGDSVRVSKPDYDPGPRSRDAVRQGTAALSYQMRWAGIGQLDLGLQRSWYRKRRETPSATEPALRDDPWLYNAALSIDLGRSLALYAGTARGLEEGPVAPDIALNRDEAPPAIRTRQIDAGMKWSPIPGLTAVAGVFRIRKPYYDLDSDQLFRRLGSVRHQGIELSLAGKITPDLSIVAGALLLDAEVEGGGTGVGRRPVGSAKHTALLSLDQNLRVVPGLSADISIKHVGAVVANTSNSLATDAHMLVDLGARYRFRMAGRDAALRLEGVNVFNAWGWDVIASGAFTYVTPRQIALKLTVDM